MGNPFLTVGALTKYIKRKFDADPYLSRVIVKGECSNVKYHSSGHVYFTLKDETAEIKSVLFRSQAQHLKFKVEEGMTVIVEGEVNVFEKAGTYQFYAETMQPDGIGALFQQYEQLKQRLKEQGLFEEKHKQPLPQFPSIVGLVTAKTGAAVQDMLTTLQRRYPLARIRLYQAIVQGEKAAPSIVSCIRRANSDKEQADVLIVGRGGGSIEDLWAFNEESVARAIFESKIPIISAVGHETDTTIADFVADLRAPTPTAAAELAVPSQMELMQWVTSEQQKLMYMQNQRIQQAKERLHRFENSPVFVQPLRLLRPSMEQFELLQERMMTSHQRYLERKQEQVLQRHNVLSYFHPGKKIDEAHRQQQAMTERLTQSMKLQFERRQQALIHQIRVLQSVNPLQILERGFATVSLKNQMIQSIHS
ncbi:MAG TPA: exodeoxyribonuclease VII large subunit, partial [Savagea sp.]